MTRFSAHWDDSLDRLGPEGAALSALLGRVPGATIFNTWEWLAASASALPEGRTLHLLRVESDGELVACLPFTRGTEMIHGMPASTLRLLGAPFTDRLVLPVLPSEQRLWDFVLDALFDGPRPWDAAVLSELPEDREARPRVEAWSAGRGSRVHWRHCARSPVLSLAFADHEGLRASYPRTLATRLRRSRKRLEKAGTVEFRRSQPAPSEVDELLAQCKGVEDASWKGSRGVGIFHPEARYRFFRDVSLRFAARGWLDLGRLFLDGRLISYRYGFRYSGRFLDYNLAFDPAFASLGAGRVLLDEMIASSLAAGLDAVDASRGSLKNPHQLADWTEGHLDHHELWILNESLAGKYLDLVRNRVRGAVRKLRKAGG